MARARFRYPGVVRAAIIVAAGFSCLFADAGAQSISPERLTPGAPLARELARDRSHLYEIGLAAGQFLTVVIRKANLPPVVAITDPAGRSLVDTSARDISVVVETAGRHLIRIRADDATGPPGPYEIVVDVRQAGEAEKARASADRLLTEGRTLHATFQVEALREAIGRFTDAVALYRRAEDRRGEARALFWIGESHRNLDTEMPKARESLNQALEVVRGTGDRELEARALVALGATYLRLEERKQALDYHQQALTLYEALSDRRGQASALGNMANAFNDLRDYGRSLEYYDRALALANGIDDRGQAAQIYNNRGLARINTGDLPGALEDFTRSIPLARSTGSPRLEQVGYQNIGIVYKELGDYRRALEAYEESIVRIRKLGLVTREALLANNIGNIYKAQNENEKALEYFNRALPIARQSKNRALEATLVNNIGSAYYQMGDFQKALEHHEQSREIRKAIGDLSGEGSSLMQAGMVLHKLGERAKALDYLRESLAIRRNLSEAIGEADTLLNIAAVERDLSDLGRARTTIEDALAFTESVRARITDAGLRASYVARVQDTYESYVDVLMRLHAQSPAAGFDRAALQAAERTRARVLLESLVEARADIRRGVDSALLERERSLQRTIDAASSRLSRALVGRSGESAVSAARKELEQATSDYADLQAQIRTSSPRYAALTQPEPLTAERIQRDVIDGDTVLLEFALGKERSWLWAVTSDSVTSVELPSRQTIEEAARALYSVLTARQPQTGETTARYAERVAVADRRVGDRAAAVSRMLFSGVADELRGPWRGKRLAIVPNGALEYLPFAALPMPQAAGTPSRQRLALLGQHEIVAAPSASVVATLRREAAERARPTRAVAVLADPVFNRDDPRVAGPWRRPAAVTASNTAPETPLE